MDLLLTAGSARCSFDMKDCQRFTAMPATLNLCRLLGEKDNLYPLMSMMTDAIHPKMKCPIEAGNYTLDKITINLNVAPLSFLPLDGSVWIMTFRVVEEKSNKVHMCFILQIKIVRRRLKN